MTTNGLGRRVLLGVAAAAPVIGRARAEAPVRIGVLTDETGPYQDSGGPGSVLAAQMAVADFGGSVLGRPVQVLHADHQNKPDVAGTIARRWYEYDGVDAIVDLPVTAIAFAVQQAARERGRTVMITAAATADLTTRSCFPTSTHWADDTHALAAGTARAVIEGGGTSWFFITVDHTFGRALQEEATHTITAAGGRVLGAVRHPIGETDYGSLLLQAQNSGAKVVGFASVGTDLVNAVKQAHEFGLARKTGQTLATFLTYITEIHALGLPTAQGLTFPASFYWNQNDESRAWARRFFAERRAMPTKNQALVYTSTLHFLKGMKEAGTADPVAVNRAMKALPVAYFGRPGSIRQDGRVLFDLTLFRVRKPGESDVAWDYYESIRSIPAAEAFLPMNASCGA
ncbi:ABC transporter substrate-binding protein [Rhodovastum atsumiense]|uniref:ABC transporter substrate-binding protein n=1 Tax=Rhodovastum atsumiense TaxID=504468 RepID=A0A5M6IZM7_9PROT|nr:ABC transporter substrate-binding protein [Rhodovastum atsumiense]KAA5613741.1 ABC transporter substrate-binding protein [Rhodovastum atsumiense]